MNTALRRFVCAGSCALALMGWASERVLFAQVFTWNRTAQDQTTIASGSVTVNGVDTNPNPNEDQSTTEDLVSSNISPSDAEPSLGGGGGDGGSGARMAANGDDGADGGDGASVDGADGAAQATAGGAGGDDGTDGSASASGLTAGILQFNMDNQPTLSWTFSHDQAADLDLEGGGGGGGGGAGANGAVFLAGEGGDGGAGEDATGSVFVSQQSAVFVEADLVRQAMSSAMPTNGRFAVDIGWVSTSTQTLENGGPFGDVWDRSATIVMTCNNASLTISGTADSTLGAIGSIPGCCCPFAASSTAELGDVTGELIIESGDFVFPMALASVATIRADGTNNTQPIFSSITGNMVGYAGGGGGGGQNNGFNGADGDDGGDGLGPAGGEGGVGGSFGGRVGGDGGEGGDGDDIDGHEDGIFQGVLEIIVDN